MHDANELPHDVGSDRNINLLLDFLLLVIIPYVEWIELRYMVTEIVTSGTHSSLCDPKLLET